jgi:hypothetical protein
MTDRQAERPWPARNDPNRTALHNRGSSSLPLNLAALADDECRLERCFQKGGKQRLELGRDAAGEDSDEREPDADMEPALGWASGL